MTSMFDFDDFRDIPEEGFKTVLFDPPWMERGGGKIKRGADKHYDLVKTKDMPAVIRGCEHWDLIETPAHMYMWVTNNFLKDGLWLMEELGFRYITNIVWTKDRIGLGQYFPGQHELCLFGVRGRGIDLKQQRASSTWLGQAAIKKRKHSQKPEEMYETIERLSPGPYLELFSRNARPGWTMWGNEAP